MCPPTRSLAGLRRHGGANHVSRTTGEMFVGQIPESAVPGAFPPSAWPNGSQPRPLVHQSKGIRITRAQTPFPVVREKFRFVRCDVNVHRAITFAAFTGKTQVERLLY